jgi:hypothetical protein
VLVALVVTLVAALAWQAVSYGALVKADFVGSLIAAVTIGFALLFLVVLRSAVTSCGLGVGMPWLRGRSLPGGQIRAKSR